MDVQQCFDVLEIDSNASIDEAKQAYKDMVNVWHPDRFSNNLRLKKKAEDRLKEINKAYEMIQSFLRTSKQHSHTVPDDRNNAAAEVNANESRSNSYYKSNNETGAKDTTEVFFETGTGIVLSLFSYLSSAVRRIIAEAKTEINQGRSEQWRKSNDMRGRGRERGRGMGSGKRMGRGRRGGRGRGGGM